MPNTYTIATRAVSLLFPISSRVAVEFAKHLLGVDFAGNLYGLQFRRTAIARFSVRELVSGPSDTQSAMALSKLQFTTLGKKRGKLIRADSAIHCFCFCSFAFNLHSSIPSLFIVIMYIL